MWLSLKIDRRLEMFICDLPTVPVSFGDSWILLVEILDGGCGADPLETQMPLCGTQGYWSGEVVPTQQKFMLAEPAPILTRHLYQEVYKAMGGRSVAGYNHVGHCAGFSYPKQRIVALNTTESSCLFVPLALLCRQKEWKTRYGHRELWSPLQESRW